VFQHDGVHSHGHVATSVFAMTKHAHRASYFANEDVDLVGTFDQTWSLSHGSSALVTFEFACNDICSVGETSEQESFFLRHFSLTLSLVCGQTFGEHVSFIILLCDCCTLHTLRPSAMQPCHNHVD